MKEENLNSLAIAIFLCANPIAWVVSFLPKAIVFIVAFCWLIVGYNRQTKKILSLPAYTHLFTLSTIVIFLFSLNINVRESVVEYLSFFLVCGVTGVYFSHLKFSIRKVFHYIAMQSVALSVFVFNIDFGDPTIDSIDYGMWMGVSYGVLRLILALIVVLLFYKREYRLSAKVFFLVALFLYAIVYANYASRGAILGVIVFLSIYFLIKGSSVRKKILLVFGGLFALLIVINFDQFMLFVSNNLSMLGIQFRALDKLQLLLMSDNIDNGRGFLIEQGLKGIYESPLYGHGIAGFEDKYGAGYYVHNLFIQILYEGGALLFVPVAAVLIGSIFLIFRNTIPQEQKIFILFLLCAGIIELLFSNVYWKSMFFWFFIFYNLRLLTKHKLKFKR